MVRTNYSVIFSFLILIVLGSLSCDKGEQKVKTRFDDFKRVVSIDNWKYTLHVENQNNKNTVEQTKAQYLKATLYMTNEKSKKSMLYTAANNEQEYEALYKYLSFGSTDDLYIRYKELFIYPIGYVFEPSNGLSIDDRLVYKFSIDDSTYNDMRQSGEPVEYWYIDRLAGLGKICFTHNK